MTKEYNRFVVDQNEFIFNKKKENTKIEINKSELIKTIRSHEGLVLRDVDVTRGGKKFTQKRWLKATEDDKPEKKVIFYDFFALFALF